MQRLETYYRYLTPRAISYSSVSVSVSFRPLSITTQPRRKSEKQSIKYRPNAGENRNASIQKGRK